MRDVERNRHVDLPKRRRTHMPLFMDVHNLDGGVAAGDVAKAHEADLKTQDQYGVNYLRYWVDEGEGKIFCLVDAPDPDTAATRAPRGARPGGQRDLSGSRRELIDARNVSRPPADGPDPGDHAGRHHLHHGPGGAVTAEHRQGRDRPIQQPGAGREGRLRVAAGRPAARVHRVLRQHRRHGLPLHQRHPAGRR